MQGAGLKLQKQIKSRTSPSRSSGSTRLLKITINKFYYSPQAFCGARDLQLPTLLPQKVYEPSHLPPNKVMQRILLMHVIVN